MSLLVDPPMLIADGELYGRAMPEGAQGRAATVVGALTVAVFWAGAVGFWLDHPLLKPVRKAAGYRSGRELMLRYPLPDRGRRRRDGREDAAFVAALAVYPLWWWVGWDHGRRARPRAA
jgi:hypothetical protein